MWPRNSNRHWARRLSALLLLLPLLGLSVLLAHGAMLPPSKPVTTVSYLPIPSLNKQPSPGWRIWLASNHQPRRYDESSKPSEMEREIDTRQTKPYFLSSGYFESLRDKKATSSSSRKLSHYILSNGTNTKSNGPQNGQIMSDGEKTGRYAKIPTMGLGTVPSEELDNF